MNLLLNLASDVIIDLPRFIGDQNCNECAKDNGEQNDQTTT